VSQLRVGVIGYGTGPEHRQEPVRHRSLRGGCALRQEPGAAPEAGRVYPGLKLTADPAELLFAPDIDAVAIVTPVWTHYELARTALENGKHVFVEKPFTATAAQAEELVGLAARKNLRIMVDQRSCSPER